MENENISDILVRRLRSRGLDKAATAAHVCATANQVGEGKFEAVSFRNGVLKIRVSSGARAHLIKLQEKGVVLKVNTRLKRDLVQRLRFEIL